MGKTHLMQAIGHEVKKRQPKHRFVISPAKKFTNEMINSLRYDKMISFRDKFRTVDVCSSTIFSFWRRKNALRRVLPYV